MATKNQAKELLLAKIAEANERREASMATVEVANVDRYVVNGEQLAQLIAEAEESGWIDTNSDEWGGTIAEYTEPNAPVDRPAHKFMFTVKNGGTLTVMGGLPGQSADERGYLPHIVANHDADKARRTRRAKREGARRTALAALGF